MRIIITGGAGFLGQRLVKALLNGPWSFKALLWVDIVSGCPGPIDTTRSLQLEFKVDTRAFYHAIQNVP